MIKYLLSIRQWLRIVLSLIYIATVALLSLMPAKDVPDVNLFSGMDKVVHFCMYFGLTILGCWSFHAEGKLNRTLLIAFFAISWGLLMEISQLEMALGRAFEWLDMVANSAGTIVGASLYWWIIKNAMSR